MKKQIEKSDIVLNINVISSMLVGYGDVFTCNVVTIKKGIMQDKQIRIVVLPKDKEQYDLSGAKKQGLFEIGFVKKNMNAPYTIMPMNGFVDSDRTSWEIVFAKQVVAKQ